jgi:DNA polymerase III subunit delta'
MAVFDSLISQRLAVSMLRRSLAGGPSHAYLFTGPRGAGKAEAAVELAAGIVCGAAGCGECSACRRVREGIHPDVAILSPEGSAMYLLDQIREINEHVAWRPFEAQARVWILLEAEALYGNQGEAANAFLRTLEEPPRHAYFIPVTDRPDRMLDTITSRCQRVLFRRIPAEAMAEYLGQHFALPEGSAEALARASQGDLGYARELATHPAAREHRERLISWARTVPRGSTLDSMVMLDEILMLVEARADAVAAEVEAGAAQTLDWAPDARSKARVEKAYEHKAKRERRRVMAAGLDEVMDVFVSWYRDLAAVALNADDAVLNTDHLSELREDSLPGLVEVYLAAVDAVRRAQQRFRYNVDARCALEDMVFTMKEALS